MISCAKDHLIGQSFEPKLISNGYVNDNESYVHNFSYYSNDALIIIEDFRSFGRMYETDYQDSKLKEYTSCRRGEGKLTFPDSLKYNFDGTIHSIHNLSINLEEDLPFSWIYEYILKSNSFFIELGGAGYHFSLNFDRQIRFNNNFGLIAGIGFSPFIVTSNKFSPRLPVQLKLFYQYKVHSIEVGTALVPYVWYVKEINVIKNFKKVNLAILGQIGYKYSMFRQRAYVGVAFTPLIFDIDAFEFYPWGALRFGYAF